MDVALTEVVSSAVFMRSPAPYVLLDHRLRIRGVNAAYAAATGRSADELTGMDMFEAFPDNPADSGADGVAQLSASLERVLRDGRVDDMLLQRYDIPSPAAASGFSKRVWSPVNSPITDVAGRAVGVLHHVEDLTGVQQPAGWNPDPSEPGQVSGTLMPVLRSRLAEVAAIAARARAEQEHSNRLTDALVQVVASRGLVGPSAAQARREWLWNDVVQQARRPGWRGWAHALCVTALQEIPGVHGVALSVHTSAGVYEVLAATDRWAEQLDELHLVVGQGPAVTARAADQPVMVADLGAELLRWPGYADAAGACGLAAAHAFPVRAQGATLATLTLYGRVPGPLTGSGATDAAMLADLAGAVVGNDLDGVFADVLSEPESAVRGPYADIAVAAGMISARHRLSVDDAMARLRATAYARGVSLVVLAADIITGKAHLD